MPGLKINFMKSEIFNINADNDVTKFYLELFNCEVGQLPMRFLGMPVTFANLPPRKKNLLILKMWTRFFGCWDAQETGFMDW
jgi:hypothetical protein